MHQEINVMNESLIKYLFIFFLCDCQCPSQHNIFMEKKYFLTILHIFHFLKRFFLFSCCCRCSCFFVASPSPPSPYQSLRICIILCFKQKYLYSLRAGYYKKQHDCLVILLFCYQFSSRSNSLQCSPLFVSACQYPLSNAKNA